MRKGRLQLAGKDSSPPEQMTMEAAVREVESQLRIATSTPKGEMAIKKEHVNKVLHS